MIKKKKEETTIKCDHCGFEESIDVNGDMVAFKEIMKEYDWHFGHKYKCLCSDCWDEGAR
jgi:hypothetical protein